MPLQPRPGSEAAVVDALAKRAAGQQAEVPAVAQGDIALAAEILEEAKNTEKDVSIVYAPSPIDVDAAASGARAAANLAIALRGEKAAESLFVLSTEANVYGVRDMGVDPELGPGRAPIEKRGMSFDEMIDAAETGALKAMIVVGDNPLMFLLPAIAAVALFAAAFIVSRAESFALIAKPLWDYGNKPALARWIKSREDRETADAERGTDAASLKK